MYIHTIWSRYKRLLPVIQNFFFGQISDTVSKHNAHSYILYCSLKRGYSLLITRTVGKTDRRRRDLRNSYRDLYQTALFEFFKKKLSLLCLSIYLSGESSENTKKYLNILIFIDQQFKTLLKPCFRCNFISYQEHFNESYYLSK